MLYCLKSKDVQNGSGTTVLSMAAASLIGEVLGLCVLVLYQIYMLHIWLIAGTTSCAGYVYFGSTVDGFWVGESCFSDEPRVHPVPDVNLPGDG